MRNWRMPAEPRADVPLAPLSTLEVGGAARFYLAASTEAEVRAGLLWARERGLPLLVLGGGSNLVVADDGFPGLVLHVRPRGLEIRRGADDVSVRVAAGEPWDAVVARAVDEGWAGLECLSGIPGLTGATPIQNVGAYGQDVAETVAHVEAFAAETGDPVSFGNAECGFGYRDSRFKREDRGRYVLLAVTFLLRPGGAPAVRYPELERALREGGAAAPTLRQVRETVIAIRRRKSMVIDPGDPNRRSVGSFFMNPVVSDAEADAVRETAARLGSAGAMPAFPAASGRTKLSAAWLIERAGLERGHRLGNAGISTNHTLAIVNLGGAAAREIVALARQVRARVRDRFGITLVPEPVFVGIDF
jgi:UDP-N-acetylmuramate dehydrogenase